MPKMTLSEVKSRMGSQNITETQSSFLLSDPNYFGRLSVVMPKIWDVNPADQPIIPVQAMGEYLEFCKDVVGDMNIEIDGGLGLIFGKFWETDEDKPYFRTEHVLAATHVLLTFERNADEYPEDIEGIYEKAYAEGADYFFMPDAIFGRRKTHEVWVAPLGFCRYVHIPEIDGEPEDIDLPSLYAERAAQIQEKFQKAQADKMAKEQASRDAIGLQERVHYIRNRIMELINDGLLGDSDFEIKMNDTCFWLEGHEDDYLLYKESTVSALEATVRAAEKFARYKKDGGNPLDIFSDLFDDGIFGFLRESFFGSNEDDSEEDA